MIYCKQASTSLERNKQILDKFTESIKSEVTRVNVIEYINALHETHCRLYEEEEEDLLLPLAISVPMLDKAHEHIYPSFSCSFPSSLPNTIQP
jgi:hypothetical protein